MRKTVIGGDFASSSQQVMNAENYRILGFIAERGGKNDLDLALKLYKKSLDISPNFRTLHYSFHSKRFIKPLWFFISRRLGVLF